MKIATTPELKLVEFGVFNEFWVWMHKTDKYACPAELRRIWNIPTNATKLWLVAYSKSAKNRVVVRRGSRRRGSGMWMAFCDGRSYQIFPSLYKKLKAAQGKRKQVYVECWYE